MLEIKTKFSNDMIRRGDSFNIIASVRNLHDKEITVNGYEISYPQGFRPTRKSGTKLQLGKETGEFFSELAPFKQLKTSEHIVENIKIPKGVERPISIPLRVGRIIGFKPRPDLYKLSFTLFYSYKGTSLNQSTEIDLRVYASLPGMLAGTILGSILGNFAISEFKFDIDKTPVEILSSLVFGFIAAIILMRRKDVQAFITIEDFWGGILIGFTVGILGKEFVINLLKSGSPLSIGQ